MLCLCWQLLSAAACILTESADPGIWLQVLNLLKWVLNLLKWELNPACWGGRGNVGVSLLQVGSPVSNSCHPVTEEGM